MKGKPRQKKGEPPGKYALRVKAWKEGRKIEEPKFEIKNAPRRKRSCATCFYRIPTDNNRIECTRYPTWKIFTDIHYCGEHKWKNPERDAK